jgi:SulP family sulfate permease
MPNTANPTSPAWHFYVPKLFTVLREGYAFADLRADVVSGLTVAIVALPLAMALGIASGATPDKGLITAVIAGFLISALGGSRVQIGGPTGAFVVVVFNVIQTHGYSGLVAATLMAGVMLIIAGLARLGTWIKYIPEPVVTGFTSGIAVIIFSSQVVDLLGLDIAKVPAEFIPKWEAIWAARATLDGPTVTLGLGILALLIVLRRFAPRLPAFLIAVVGASLAVLAFNLPVDTIGSRFGGIPRVLPVPSWPDLSLHRLPDLFPSAFTIAFLAGVESLLSAMVADGMTGRRHRSNCELVAQGVANVVSALFGGLPATGAIARTATNIRAGARSPLSGMLHAAFLLAFMLLLAPLASYVPLASLAAVLMLVAWNMSEAHRFINLLDAPIGDRLVLLATFTLTVLVDLTVAIEVGVVLASVLFMHRMSEVVAVRHGDADLIDTEVDDLSRASREIEDQRTNLPPGVEVFRLNGPLFFGVTTRLSDVLNRTGRTPKVIILRMRQVPFVDASGQRALADFVASNKRRGTTVIISGLQRQPEQVFRAMGLVGDGQTLHLVPTFRAALDLAAGRPESVESE